MSAARTALFAGPAVVYLAPTGEALPEINDLTPPAISGVSPGGNWTKIDHVMDAVQLSFSREFQEVDTFEALGSQKLHATKESASIALKVGDRTFDNVDDYVPGVSLETVAAAADQVAQTIASFGGAGVTEMALLAIISNENSGDRIVHVPICVSVGEASEVMSREHNGMDIELKVLADPTATAGQEMFRIYSITAAATT